MSQITPVILCGGLGQRLWPLSIVNSSLPKQFIKLFDHHSLVQNTLLRCRDQPFLADPILVTNYEYHHILQEQLNEIGWPTARVILEPQARNTGPAALLASLVLATEGCQDDSLLILPIDHYFDDHQQWFEAVVAGERKANKKAIVVFGTPPSSADSRYGYIKKAKDASQSDFFHVSAFIEKPNSMLAAHYFASGQYLWNMGIYLSRCRTLIDAFCQHAPAVYSACVKALEYGIVKSNQIIPDDHYFTAAPCISIDKAIAEKYKHIYCQASTKLMWEDVGSWPAVMRVASYSGKNNFVQGQAVLHEVNNSYVYSPNKRLVLMGLKDVMVLNLEGMVVVAHKDMLDQLTEVQILQNSQNNLKE